MLDILILMNLNKVVRILSQDAGVCREKQKQGRVDNGFILQVWSSNTVLPRARRKEHSQAHQKVPL